MVFDAKAALKNAGGRFGLLNMGIGGGFSQGFCRANAKSGTYVRK
jgi:hypothetical protein